MSAATVAPPQLTDQPSAPRPEGVKGERVRHAGGRGAGFRRGARAGRGHAPVARPSRVVGAALSTPVSVAQPRGCVVTAPAPDRREGLLTPTPGLRLTDRGIAVILVVSTVIVLAALTVIGLTAVTVTGDGHASISSIQTVQP